MNKHEKSNKKIISFRNNEMHFVYWKHLVNQCDREY